MIEMILDNHNSEQKIVENRKPRTHIDTNKIQLID